MKLHELKPTEGSRKDGYRLGRGVGSGNGKTAGKGHKGQLARSGGQAKVGFEGGQTPLARRLPKRGFSHKWARKDYETVNIGSFEDKFKAGANVGPEEMKEAGLIKSTKAVKVLGDGELEKGLNVKAHKFSKSAAAMIEKAGGKAEVI
jgi:large subunit ribosomal protein L15